MTDVHNQIDEVLAKFDYALTREVMRAVGWIWTDERSGTRGLPTEDAIREKARALLFAAATYGTGYCSGGGLVARKEQSGSLSLAFEVTSAICSTVPMSDLPPL